MRTAKSSPWPSMLRSGVLGLALLSAACTPTKAPDAGGGTAGGAGSGGAKKGKDTLVVAVGLDAEMFLSMVQQSSWDQALEDNMFLSPTASDFDCRIKSSPWLAESFEAPPDGLSITYHLKQGLTWSDGVPITAKDIAFTYELVADPVVASPRIDFIEKMKPDARPRVLDDHTVRFEFTEPYDHYSQMAHTNLNPVPEHIVSKLDRKSLRATDFDKAPVVSGPWKIGKWEKNQSLTLVPNEAYKGPDPPTLTRVVFKVIPDYSARLVALEAGEVDMIENLQNMDDIARLKQSHPEIKMYRRGYRFLDYVAWNSKNELFADREVRRALTMAIDRGKIIKDLLTTADGESFGKEAVSNVSPALCDYQAEIPVIPFDLAKAKEVLAAKGWKDTDGDGVVDKDGKPFRFTLLTNTSNARREKASVIIQANLKELGVDAELARVETNNFFERLRKKDYEAALSGWSAALFVDPTEIWHSDTETTKKHEFNFTSYSNPKADDLMERAMKIVDPAESAKLLREMQQVIYDDQPYTFLYWRDEVVPLHERFQGAKIDIGSFIHDLNLWWVPEDKVKIKF